MTATLNHSKAFRFSLRTLFVLVTIACCWMGYQVYLQREGLAFQEYANAVNAEIAYAHQVDKSGNTIHFDAADPPPTHTILVATFGLEGYLSPYSISIPESNKDDQSLQRLLEHPRTAHARNLTLDHCKVCPECVSAIKSLRLLESLSAMRSGITNTGVEELAALTELKYLDLSGNEIDSESIASLVSLRKLEMLIVRDTGLSDADVTKLRTAMPNCEIFTGYEHIMFLE